MGFFVFSGVGTRHDPYEKDALWPSDTVHPTFSLARGVVEGRWANGFNGTEGLGVDGSRLGEAISRGEVWGSLKASTELRNCSTCPARYSRRCEPLPVLMLICCVD